MTPFDAPAALVGASVKLSIAVQSTAGEVLAVPISALSIGADGRERVQVDRGGRASLVYVRTGLRAQGLVEVSPRRAGELKEGDLVVVGAGARSAGKGADRLAAPRHARPASSTTPSAAARRGVGRPSGRHRDDAGHDAPRRRRRAAAGGGRARSGATATAARAPSVARDPQRRFAGRRRPRAAERPRPRRELAPSSRSARWSSCATSAARTAASRPCARCAASTSSSSAATRSRSSARPARASRRC